MTDRRSGHERRDHDAAVPGASSPFRDVPFVTVIMPIRNEGSFLEASLGSVLQQDYSENAMEVIVADGLSTDGTRAIVRRLASRDRRLKMIDNPERIVPTGLNRALRVARGEVIVRVDGHTVVERDYVSQCVAALRRTEADNVGGPMRAEGHGRFGAAVAAATGSPFGVGSARFHYSDREEWVDTVYLGAWARSVFERIGVFDETMIRDQDDEFNYRLLDRGGRILLSPRIRSRYVVRSTPASLWRQYFQYGYWKVRVMLKHPRQARPRQLAPPVFVLALLLSVVVLAAGEGQRRLGLIVPLAYVATNAAASVAVARRVGWKQLAWTALAYAILHLSYGLGFLAGMVPGAAAWIRGRGRAGQDTRT